VISAEHVTKIAASQKRVFDFVADAGRQSEWHPRVKSVERLSEGPPASGSKYRGIYSGFGSVEFETVQFLDPQLVAFRSQTKGGQMTHSFEISEDGGETRLTQRMELVPQGMMRFIGPAMKSALGRQLAKNGEALRERLDGTG
jgi:Polyketide cyclase / dehydrase and lipid transport